jgi:hypothetical protein
VLKCVEYIVDEVKQKKNMKLVVVEDENFVVDDYEYYSLGQSLCLVELKMN